MTRLTRGERGRANGLLMPKPKGGNARSVAQWAALERDEWRCQWCLYVLERLTIATDAHHIFRPRKDYDRPEYIISLCHEHHLGDRHTKGTLTDEDIIQRLMIPWIWCGEDLTPKTSYFFPNHEQERPTIQIIHPSNKLPPEFIA
jgi:hypothetical protein